MEVSLALVADAANVTPEGKLNILGTFDTISPAEFPYSHPSMVLVVRFAARPAEFGRKYLVEINLMDADAKTLGKAEGGVKIDKPGAGLIGHAQLIANMANTSFPYPGNYEFSILVEGQVKATVPLYIVKR